MKIIQNLASLLMFIGCLNYGIQAVFEFNLFTHLFYNLPTTLKFLYLLISIAAFIHLSDLPKNEKK